MIEPIEMYGASCDNCKKQFETAEGWSALTEKDRLKESLMDSEWTYHGENCYCPDCHYINDDDDLVIRIETNFKPNK